jgi:mRNA-degrading endonuclease RelE of RelBE toxin-antitoxin system
MDVEFRITDKFDSDLKKFSEKKRQIIAKKLNRFAIGFKQNPNYLHKKSRKVNIPIKLKSGNTPSLYSIRIDDNIRVISTFDSDPIYNQIIITLFRCVRSEEMVMVFRGIAEALYQNDLYFIEREDPGDENVHSSF